MQSLRDLGERNVVKRLVGIYAGTLPSHCLDPEDDAGCLPLSEGYLLVNIDGYSVKQSMLPWMTWYDLGWKSIVGAASDILAKGGKPMAALSSIGLKPERRFRAAESLVSGMVDACRELGMHYLGGDMNSGLEEWVDVAALGFSELPLPRGAAKPGDIIYTTGSYGLTGAGFHMYSKGAKPSPSSWPHIYEATTRPLAPKLFLEIVEEFGKNIHAGIDVSDGLSETAYLLAEASGSTVVLENIPVHEEAEKYAENEGVDSLELALYGGEEYEIIFTVDPNITRELEERFDVTRIGRIVRGAPLVFLGEEVLKRGGWDQFKSSWQ